jgi:hypothetical protein
MVLSVAVPANSRARVSIPKPAGAERVVLEESGTVLWPAGEAKPSVPGVLSVENAGDAIQCCVGAGEYRFTARRSPSADHR